MSTTIDTSSMGVGRAKDEVLKRHTPRRRKATTGSAAYSDTNRKGMVLAKVDGIQDSRAHLTAKEERMRLGGEVATVYIVLA